MQSTLDTTVFSLIEATVSLYPASASGAPWILGPIFSGLPAETLSRRERWVKSETRPTGAQYPVKHPLVQQYEISIGRVWGFQNADMSGFATANGLYVLDIVWVDAVTGNWHRETYYNVTISERSQTPPNIEQGFMDDQVFDAEYVVRSGGLGTVPAISSSLPMTVKWVGPDYPGGLPLYNYDPTANTFAETVAGISANRAGIAYNPAGGLTVDGAITVDDDEVTVDVDEVFAIVFSGSDSAAMTVDINDGLDVTGLETQAPDTSINPRLDFYIGSVRVASLGADGTLYATSFSNGPVAAAGQFQLFVGSTLAVTIAASGVAAIAYDENAENTTADSGQITADSGQITADQI